MPACWSCQKETANGPFCPFCGKIQPPAQADYFELLGVPRAVNIAPETLEGRFHELSRQLHPDYFLRASEKEKTYSMQHSSRLNDTYRTLKDPVTRLDYLLSLHGLQSGTNQQQAPADLLEEVLEATEQLAELQTGNLAPARVEEAVSHLQSIRNTLNKRRAELDSELRCLGGEWDSAGMPEDSIIFQSLLQRLQQNQLRRIFISNLIRRIDEGIPPNVQSSRH